MLALFLALVKHSNKGILLTGFTSPSTTITPISNTTTTPNTSNNASSLTTKSTTTLDSKALPSPTTSNYDNTYIPTNRAKPTFSFGVN
jgi:hypothetical protein